MFTIKQIIKKLKLVSNPTKKNLTGMARYGINTANAWCVSTPNLIKISKEIKKDPPEHRHRLALELWKTNIREARILAALIDLPELVTKKQMNAWVKNFNSWDICDNTIMHLFSYSKLACGKAIEWSKRKKEFEKRAGFALMASLAVRDKKIEDKNFYPFLERIKAEATDERNFVKKAVNWALRQIGKSRTKNLYEKTLKTAQEILMIDDKTAHWVAKDTIRELTTTKYVLKRFK